MAPFGSLFHPMHPAGIEPHRPVRFLGQLIDDPVGYHPQHRARTRHRDLLAPDFDVRESESAYFLEGEFPGIADRNAIKLEWVDNRTLAIDARIAKVDLVAEWGLGPLPGDDIVITDAPPLGQPHPPAPAAAGGAGGVVQGKEVVERRLPAAPLREWLSERRLGHYQRTFTFPADVDATAVKARLGQGLLRIMVPKMRETNVRAKQVPIESVE